MDRDSITRELAKDLAKAHVKPPPPGKYGEYIEGWLTQAEANRIFGWDGWSYRVDRLEQTNCAEFEKTKDGQTYMQWEIGYFAVVTATAASEDGPAVSKQDVGHGQGHSKSLGDAHDSAMKEAVTDALKRALRTFGNPLGLALYDKTKAHVSLNPNAAEERETAIAAITTEKINNVIGDIENIWDSAELGGYWNGLAKHQPGMQKAEGVAEAKDAQKKAIEERRSVDETNASTKAGFEADGGVGQPDSADADQVPF